VVDATWLRLGSREAGGQSRQEICQGAKACVPPQRATDVEISGHNNSNSNIISRIGLLQLTGPILCTQFGTPGAVGKQVNLLIVTKILEPDVSVVANKRRVSKRAVKYVRQAIVLPLGILAPTLAPGNRLGPSITTLIVGVCPSGRENAQLSLTLSVV